MAQSQEGPATPGLHTHRWLLAPPRPHCPTGVGGRNEPADGHCPQAVEERVVLEQVSYPGGPTAATRAALSTQESQETQGRVAGFPEAGSSK